MKETQRSIKAGSELRKCFVASLPALGMDPDMSHAQHSLEGDFVGIT